MMREIIGIRGPNRERGATDLKKKEKKNLQTKSEILHASVCAHGQGALGDARYNLPPDRYNVKL